MLVWQIIRQDKHTKRFLASYFFYIAGVHTVIYLATLFADRELGFKDSELILTLSLIHILHQGVYQTA